MSQLDEILQKINKFITIDSQDRAPYAADFEFVRDTIINKLKQVDKIFEKLYNGPCLGGSYADNLKISKPDEYDLVLRIKLRESNLIQIEKDKNLAGYCNINIKEAMKKIKTETQNKDIFEHFEKLITPDGYLIQDKVQSWIESSMTRALKELDNGIIKNQNKKYELKYTKAGPAHTINVTQGNKFISMDLVPAFIFDKTKWIAKRQLPSKTPPTCQNWIAVPKPVKGSQTPNISFITSYVDTERHLITNKNSLKNTLKMLKKLRDRRNLNNLKSYFIKTMYLWETEVQPDSFWDKPTSFVLMHMIDKLIGYLENENLPFFWDSSQNMLGNLKKNQILSIQKEILNAQKILTTNILKVYDLFLTSEEKEKLFATEMPVLSLDHLNNKTLLSPSNEKGNSNSKTNQNRSPPTMANSSTADRKVFQIREILQKYANNSEKILIEIQKVINASTDDVSTLTSIFSYFGFSNHKDDNAKL